MPSILLRQRFTQQPQQAVQIDWSNPLTKGLIFCVPGIGGNYDDIAGGKKATVTGVTRGNTVDGQFAHFNGAARLDYAPFGAELPRTGPMTIAFIDRAVNPSAYGTIVDFLPGGGGSEFMIYQGAAPYGFAVGMRGASGSPLIPEFTDSLGIPTHGKLRRIVVRNTGDLETVPTPPDKITVFVGQAKYTTTKSTNILSGAASVNRWGQVGTGGEAWDGVIGMKCIWNRDLSDAEILSYNANPWQIFRAPARRVWFADVGAGGPAVYSYSASGGLSLGGSVVAWRGVTRASVGGIQLAGAAPSRRSVVRTSAGGIALAGAASTVRSRILAAAGGLILAGAALVSTSKTAQSLIVSPVGGLILRGAASVVRTVSAVASGGIRFAGRATYSNSGPILQALGNLLPTLRRRRR